jgi:hypothetical protein
MPTYRIEGEIYEAATPDEAYAKHDQAIKGSPVPAAPRGKESMGTGQMLAQAMVNFPRSAYELGKSTFEAVTSPIETGKAVLDLGSSVLGKMGVTDASPEMADRVGKFYTNRYGGVENAKNTFATDPAGFLADAATILTGGGTAVRQIPGAAKVGKAVERAGAVIDPLNVAAKAVKGGGKAAAVGLGFTTGTGTRAVEEAAKAGYRGGEQGQAFVGQMRGTAPVTDVVETIKPAIASLREQRSKAYREGMAGVTKDKSVLKFNDIDNAINKVKGRGYFEGKSKDPAAASAWQELKTVVDDWKSGDPAVYHTVEGVDALKQAVGSIRDSLPYNTPARNAANEVYSAIRGEITRQAPDYARVMSEYETASDLLNEISTTLSQNPKASIDTQVRKLQSILRNNANTNYGRRVELGEMLASQGASNLFPQLAGQAMSSFSPRGLSGALAGAGALYSTVPNLAQGLTPTGALQLASTSPRAVGEMTYAAGKVAGKPAQLAQLLAKHGDKLAQSNPQMAMAVDMARRSGGKVNPQTARLLAYQLAQFERATEE